MTLAPYLLALTFGLLISALLHFVLVWPGREPAEDADASGDQATSRPPADARPPTDARTPPRQKSRRR
jgi:hypothetical protein